MKKLKTYVISLIISFVISVIFLCVAASIFAYTNINDRYLDSCVFGIVTVSVLIGSLIIGKKIKEKGLIYGALYGLIFCGIIYFFNIIALQGFFVTNTLFMYLSICTLSGIVGGVVGVNI